MEAHATCLLDLTRPGRALVDYSAVLQITSRNAEMGPR